MATNLSESRSHGKRSPRRRRRPRVEAISRSLPSATCGCTSRGWATLAEHGAGDRARRGPLRVRRRKRYLGRLSALYCVTSATAAALGEAAARQARELGFYTNWSYAHPRSIELGDAIRTSLPGTSTSSSSPPSGSEAVESAWKLAKAYHAARGGPVGTRSSPATSPTTAPRWAPLPRPACRRCASRSSR